MSSEIEKYRSFVDDLVKLNSSVDAAWMQRGYWPQTRDNEPVNDLLSRLSLGDRELLASIIEDARASGIHDMLAYVQEQMDSKELKIISGGVELPNSPFGTELHFDWISRLKGDEWPQAK